MGSPNLIVVPVIVAAFAIVFALVIERYTR